MDNNELRQAVANVKYGDKVELKWARHERGYVGSIEYNKESFQQRWIKSGEAFQWPFHSYSAVPNWPEDIGAAWELVEEMKSHYETLFIMGWNRALNLWQVNHDELMFTADTAPRAICLAYLAWKESAK